MSSVQAVQALVDEGVDFVIVVGWSAILHGSSMPTDDLGICYSGTTENLKRLARTLAPFRPRRRGIPENQPFVWDDVTLRNASLLTLSTDLGDINLLAEITGVGGFVQVKEHLISLTRSVEQSAHLTWLP